MRIERIEDFTRGWFVGNFEPTVYKTEKFEVGLLSHEKGPLPCHYHTGIEINCIVSGELEIHGQKLVPGDVFTIEPYEIVDPVILKDCVIVVVKTPSMPGDKYDVECPKREEK